MRYLSRRNFLKYSAAGMAGLAAQAKFPFLGRRSALAQSGNYFTIAVIPDTQNYTDGRYQPAYSGGGPYEPPVGNACCYQTNQFNLVPNLTYFTDQMNYLVTYGADWNLAFVTHVGDVVQNGDGYYYFNPNSPFFFSNGPYTWPNQNGQYTEWLNAQTAIDILAGSGVPFGLCIGNHDYDNMYDHGGPNPDIPLWSTVWTQYFGSGSPYFAGKPWYGGASNGVGFLSPGVNGFPAADTPCNYGLSSYQLFSACNRNFLHISLELEPSDLAIEWAQGVINTYQGYATIVSTHAYMYPPALGDPSLPLVVPAQLHTPQNLVTSSYPTGMYGPNININGAQGIWDQLIAPNDQIFMVLCGHWWGGYHYGYSPAENILVTPNNYGHPVYQVLTDYQGNTTLGSAGGDGWLRLMQFNMDIPDIHFWTYNTSFPSFAGTESGPVYSNGMYDFYQPALFSDFTLSNLASATNLSLPFPVQILNAQPQVTIESSGFLYSRVSKHFTGNLLLTNTSVFPVAAPIYVALNKLTSGVTLVNSAGTYNGAPYVASSSGLSAGASLTIPLVFSDPSMSSINFTPAIVQL